MTKGLKLVLTVLVLLLAVASWAISLIWVNLPSDRSFWSGILGALLLPVLVPSAIAAIWSFERLK